MVMTTCAECGGSLSTTAKACPHCGARGPQVVTAAGAAQVWFRRAGQGVVLVVALLLLVLLVTEAFR